MKKHDFRKDGIKYKAPTAIGASMSSIQKLAEEIATVLDIENAARITDSVSMMGGRIHFSGLSELADGTIYVHAPNDFDICLPTFHSPSIRDRFTIAHEIGHYILHSKFGKEPIIAMRSASGKTEWEANWFAAALLMPSEKFKKAWGQLRQNEGDVAVYFGVSISAANIRAKALELK